MDRDQHLSVGRKLGPIAHWFAMPRDDDRLVRCCSEIGLRRPNHSFDASTGRIVDERINAVPVSITGVKNIRLTERGRYITVGTGWLIMFQRDCCAIQLQSLLRGENL